MGKLLSLFTSANPYLLLAIFAIGFGSGSFLTYKIEHSKVLAMELKIANQKVEAATILAKEKDKVLQLEETQRNLNIELDKSHDSYIQTSNAYSAKLDDAISGLQFTDSRKGGSGPTSESNNSTINPTDAEEFTWVSKELLKYLAEESRRAEQDGIDKNTLIIFVKEQNCGIPK
jgi:hypothetical protein